MTYLPLNLDCWTNNDAGPGGSRYSALDEQQVVLCIDPNHLEALSGLALDPI